MAYTEETIQRLTRLRETRKFTDSGFEKSGLNPSGSDTVNEMIRLTNLCLDELLIDVQTNKSESQVKETLLRGLKRFKVDEYDSEEKEFIGDEFHKIGTIIGFNISNNLNEWLYGKVLGAMINLMRKKEVVIRSVSFECSRCHLQLILKITSSGAGVPSYWIIGQCDHCGEYSLIETGENSGGMRFEGFTSIETLDSTETSAEQAITRLEQIRYFRGRN